MKNNITIEEYPVKCLKQPKQKLGRWEGGIWNPTEKQRNSFLSIEKPKVEWVKVGENTVRAVIHKPLAPLQKYQKACDIYSRQREIKQEVAKLLAEYRSIAQKLGEYLTNDTP